MFHKKEDCFFGVEAIKICSYHLETTSLGVTWGAIHYFDDSNLGYRHLSLSQMTNFRPFQTQRGFESTISNFMKMAESYSNW